MLCSALMINAQQGVGQGKISGRVVDSNTGKTIDHASIGLLNQDNKEINGTTSNEKGEFSIDHIASGTYKVAVFYAGYKNKTTADIQLGEQ